MVERYHSNTLGQAIPDELAREWGGQPGDLIVIYQKAAAAPDPSTESSSPLVTTSIELGSERGNR